MHDRIHMKLAALQKMQVAEKNAGERQNDAGRKEKRDKEPLAKPGAGRAYSAYARRARAPATKTAAPAERPACCAPLAAGRVLSAALLALVAVAELEVVEAEVTEVARAAAFFDVGDDVVADEDGVDDARPTEMALLSAAVKSPVIEAIVNLCENASSESSTFERMRMK